MSVDLTTRDCVVPGCPDEALKGILCDFHRANPTKGALPNGPGALAHLMNDDEETTVNVCKIDGCSNESAGKGGWCVGLCSDHISAEGRRRQLKRHANKPKTVKPPPAATVPVTNSQTVIPAANTKPATNGHAPLTLTELAQAVDQAHTTYTDALERLREAVAAA